MNNHLVRFIIIAIFCSLSLDISAKHPCKYRDLKKYVKLHWHHNKENNTYDWDSAFQNKIFLRNDMGCFKGLSKKEVISLFGQPSYIDKHNDFVYCQRPDCKSFIANGWRYVFGFDRQEKFESI